MLKVGIIGFGGMGHFHAAQYPTITEAELVAVADTRPGQLEAGSLKINLGASGCCDLSKVRTYRSADEMLARERLDAVDICLPTDLHAEYAIRALRAGCHVLCEKPMARTLPEAEAMQKAATDAGRTLMIAQCLRFWPAYVRLREAHRSGEFGRLLMLSMRRFSPVPGWGGTQSWFADGKRSGGALLDMHIHETDYVNWLLGVPNSVVTSGATFRTGAVDNAVTQYFYDGGPVVAAETSWGYGGSFSAAFCAIFEHATLEAGYKSADLALARPGAPVETVSLPARDPYREEIAYFVDCVLHGREPDTCTASSTRETIRIANAEAQSAAAGGARVMLRDSPRQHELHEGSAESRHGR
jgi:predicted dehydrogenase